MTKPIAMMYLPDDWKTAACEDFMSSLNGWNDTGKPQPGIDGYLWLVFNKPNIDAPEIQVHNAENLTPEDFESLKLLVLAAIEESKQAQAPDEIV